MARTAGRPEVAIGLIDGPVAENLADLSNAQILRLAPPPAGLAAHAGTALSHGAFVAGMLCARRDSPAPAICPGCTLVVRPIFDRTASASPEELAAATIDCIEAGAQVLNLSLAMALPTTRPDRALNYLVVRYPAIYATTAARHAENGALTGVEVGKAMARLSGTRRIVDVIFSYTHRQTDVTIKYFVRVDVTEEFPFLVSKLAPFYER